MDLLYNSPEYINLYFSDGIQNADFITWNINKYKNLQRNNTCYMSLVGCNVEIDDVDYDIVIKLTNPTSYNVISSSNTGAVMGTCSMNVSSETILIRSFNKEDIKLLVSSHPNIIQIQTSYSDNTPCTVDSLDLVLKIEYLNEDLVNKQLHSTYNN